MAFFSELRVDRYRGIQNLKICNLKQVNLIVGDNNCGKTSVLEAIQLLRTSGSLANVYRVARQRDVLSLSNANSVFDSFMYMFPHGNKEQLELRVSGVCDDVTIQNPL